MINNPVWAQVVYLVAAIAFILSLKGLSGPKTARMGSRVGALGAFIAIVTLFAANIHLKHLWLIVIALAIGTIGGYFAAVRVKMTQMPQLVALFNGAGGGTAMLVASIEFLQNGQHETKFALAATVFTVLIGSVSFTGSIVTFLKLQELMTTKPIVYPGGKYTLVVIAAAALAAAAWVFASPSNTGLIVTVALSLILGVMVVLPVGGADVPIVISLLNAFTGLSVAASGYVIGNVLLLVAGTLVGASGTILTMDMAKAMGRSVLNTMFGAFNRTAAASGGAAAEDRPVRSAGPADIGVMLAYAQKVIFVPGYGLAVAQAQNTLRELADQLTSRGIEVAYAIHPVAGRMPGHMNVLLAEADVPYDQLLEMDEINPQFRDADVAVIVGANDVVNPAARTDTSSPIYGMPILNADESQQIVFLKRSMRPGFAGVDNELMFSEKTTMLFGDAKDTLTKVVASVKAM